MAVVRFPVENVHITLYKDCILLTCKTAYMYDMFQTWITPLIPVQLPTNQVQWQMQVNSRKRQVLCLCYFTDNYSLDTLPMDKTRYCTQYDIEKGNNLARVLNTKKTPYTVSLRTIYGTSFVDN